MRGPCQQGPWALHLGIDIWLDLKSDQGKQFPIEDGKIISIDGSLFTSALPLRLRPLQRHDPFMTERERQELFAKYDERAKYAFTRNGAADEDGYEQWVGPAVRGKVRCPNHPKSLRSPQETRPTTDCASVDGEPACGCGRSITLPPDLNAKIRQPEPYGTTEWWRRYKPRASVESANSLLHHHHSHVRRQYTRVFGLARNSLFLTAAVVGANVERQRGFRQKHKMPDPWADVDGTPAEKPEPKTRRSRRTKTWDDLLSPAPSDD
jgi:hypothetical protein